MPGAPLQQPRARWWEGGHYYHLPLIWKHGPTYPHNGLSRTGTITHGLGGLPWALRGTFSNTWHLQHCQMGRLSEQIYGVFGREIKRQNGSCSLDRGISEVMKMRSGMRWDASQHHVMSGPGLLLVPCLGSRH